LGPGEASLFVDDVGWWIVYSPTARFGRTGTRDPSPWPQQTSVRTARSYPEAAADRRGEVDLQIPDEPVEAGVLAERRGSEPIDWARGSGFLIHLRWAGRLAATTTGLLVGAPTVLAGIAALPVDWGVDDDWTNPLPVGRPEPDKGPGLTWRQLDTHHWSGRGTESSTAPSLPKPTLARVSPARGPAARPLTDHDRGPVRDRRGGTGRDR
jgi:hypothetical protein